MTCGREPEAGEPLAWLRRINVFRRPDDLELLLGGLAQAGLAGPHRAFAEEARGDPAAARARARGALDDA